MLPSSKFVALSLVVLVACLLQASAVANTSHHHIGGSSHGDDTDADCLRWGFLTADGAAGDGASPDSSPYPAEAGDGSADADGSDAPDAGNDRDAGGADASPSSDGGSGRLPGMVCLERATLFGCDCATTDGAPARPSAVVAAVLVFGLLRRRSARRQKDGR